jgi:hypothetical protein
MSVSEELSSGSKKEISIRHAYSFVRVRPAQISYKSSSNLQKLEARIVNKIPRERSFPFF